MVLEIGGGWWLVGLSGHREEMLVEEEQLVSKGVEWNG